MEKLGKFNHRAELIEGEANEFAFGIIIRSEMVRSFSFELFDEKLKNIPSINLNEWKIYSITSERYYTRDKLFIEYSDPKGSRQKLETGGRTLSIDNDNGINSMMDFVSELFSYFFRISCFEDIKSVIAKKEKYDQKKEYYFSRDYDHLFYNTSL
jgi:hypothetical protein